MINMYVNGYFNAIEQGNLKEIETILSRVAILEDEQQSLFWKMVEDKKHKFASERLFR